MQTLMISALHSSSFVYIFVYLYVCMFVYSHVCMFIYSHVCMFVLTFVSDIGDPQLVTWSDVEVGDKG